MRRICAWCGRPMPGNPEAAGPEDQVTDGICEPCMNWMRLSEDELCDMLERLAGHIRRRGRMNECAGPQYSKPSGS